MEKYTLQELRTPGTVLPINARQVKVNLSDRSKDAYCNPWTLLKIPRKSFGSTTRNTEECILVEGLTYDGNWFYEVPISEFRRLGLLDEFVLPEKWQILRTPENYAIVNEWMNKHHNLTPGVHGYYSSSAGYANNFNITKIDEGSTEITFEQFKEYVLKENNMKKIIGYKSKDQQSFNNAKKLADPGTYFGTGCTFSNGDTFTPGSGHADFFQKAGVLYIWFTPIYEEDRIKKLGKYDVSMDGAFVKVGCTTYSKDALWGAKQVLEAPNVQAIKCDGLDLTLEDVNNLLKYFE